MSLKDLTVKSELYAKLAMKRVAQTAGDPWSGMKPEDVSSMPVDQLQNQLFPRATPPTGTPAPQGTGTPAPQSAAAKPSSAVSVPAAAAAVLAPFKGKGLLNVVLNGNNLNVTFNAHSMTGRGHGNTPDLASQLKAALPGFTVTVIGKTEFPPQMANY